MAAPRTIYTFSISAPGDTWWAELQLVYLGFHVFRVQVSGMFLGFLGYIFGAAFAFLARQNRAQVGQDRVLNQCDDIFYFSDHCHLPGDSHTEWGDCLHSAQHYLPLPIQ